MPAKDEGLAIISKPLILPKLCSFPFAKALSMPVLNTLDISSLAPLSS